MKNQKFSSIKTNKGRSSASQNHLTVSPVLSRLTTAMQIQMLFLPSLKQDYENQTLEINDDNNENYNHIDRFHLSIDGFGNLVCKQKQSKQTTSTNYGTSSRASLNNELDRIRETGKQIERLKILQLL